MQDNIIFCVFLIKDVTPRPVVRTTAPNQSNPRPTVRPQQIIRNQNSTTIHRQVAPQTVSSQGGTSSIQSGANQSTLENVKKCKNFLSTLIKLAASQPQNTVNNVRSLIQGLIVSAIIGSLHYHRYCSIC